MSDKVDKRKFNKGRKSTGMWSVRTTDLEQIRVPSYLKERILNYGISLDTELSKIDASKSDST